MEVMFDFGTNLDFAIEESIFNTLNNKCDTYFNFNGERYKISYNDIISTHTKIKQ